MMAVFVGQLVVTAALLTAGEVFKGSPVFLEGVIGRRTASRISSLATLS